MTDQRFPLSTPGRPTKLTPELGARLIEMVSRGHYKRTAANACGIHESTLYEWIARGDVENRTRVEINPNDYTKAELLELASENGLDLSTKLRKDEIAAELNSSRSIFSEFSEALHAAETLAEVFATEAMLETGRNDWRMWRDYLARTRPERWGNVATRPYDVEPGAEDLPEGAVDPAAALARAREIRLKVLPGGRESEAS